jgi:gas vesicle protein
MSDDRRSSLDLVLAFLLGAAAGATVALLTAPQSGKESREKLKQLARDAAGEAARIPERAGDAYARAARAAREAFVRALEDAVEPGRQAR